jgi:hypothetical protein
LNVVVDVVVSLSTQLCVQCPWKPANVELESVGRETREWSQNAGVATT